MGRAFAVVLVLIGLCSSASATEEFADRTGVSCELCHRVAFDGGELTELGEAYFASGLVWPPPDVPAPLGPGLRGALSVIFGLLHVIAAFLWIGTIMYVHLVLRPKYALGGLPKAEMRLAWVSILVIGLSGAGLLWVRFANLGVWFASSTGRLMIVKIGLYGFLVLSAAFVTLFLSPRLKRLKSGWQANDGQEGRPAWVKVDDRIYDVTGSPQWKDGSHFTRHQAGQDLTAALDSAPHGPEKLDGFESMPAQGAQHRHRSQPVRALLVMAYVNLAVAVGVLVVITLMRFA